MKNNNDNMDFMAEVEQLQEKITSLQQRLKLVEENKDKVRPKIYEKVKGDYESKLESLFQELEPFKEKIEAQINTIESDIEAQTSERDGYEEELEELQLRFLAGEFTEDEFAPQKEELESKMATCEEVITAKSEEIKSLKSKLAFITGEPEEEIAEEEAIEEEEIKEEEVPEAAEEEIPAQPEEAVASYDDFGEMEEEFEEHLEEKESSFSEELEEADEEFAPALMEETVGGEGDFSDDALVKEEEPDIESDDDYIWTSTPVLDVIEGDFAGESYPMDKERITIGRGPNNDIQLATDTSVSRHHAQLTFENNRYVLVDLESSNGTSVNGIRITRTYLRPNDEIMIGQSKLVIRPSED